MVVVGASVVVVAGGNVVVVLGASVVLGEAAVVGPAGREVVGVAAVVADVLGLAGAVSATDVAVAVLSFGFFPVAAPMTTSTTSTAKVMAHHRRHHGLPDNFAGDA